MSSSFSRGAAARIAYILGSLTGLACYEAAPVSAQSFFAARRDFVLTKACDATLTIATKRDPKSLPSGAVVVARGLNRSGNPTHAFVMIEKQNRWIDLDCGEFMDGEVIADSGETDARPGRAPQCLPFFDDVDNPVEIKVGGKVDVTPRKPELNAFDKAINATCGAPGKSVSLDEFKAMMLAHPEVLDRVKAFTGSKVFADRPARSARSDYLTDLTEAWFAEKGFDHIFCGQPNPSASQGKIGGLHFVGRYVQLQEAGQACRMSNPRQNEVFPGFIYTMGVLMQNASGRYVRDARKGYGLTLSGEDILKAATSAFLENAGGGGDKLACLAPIVDAGKQFTAVFVRRRAGIVTLYPDATPSTTDPACKTQIKL